MSASREQQPTGSARWGAAAKHSAFHTAEASLETPQGRTETRSGAAVCEIRTIMCVRNEKSADYMATLSLVFVVSGIGC